jgi:N-acetylglutamate synthase-like GNAT family acetyltransferase
MQRRIQSSKAPEICGKLYIIMIRPFRSEDAQSCCDLIQTCLDFDPSISPSLLKKLRETESPKTILERAKLFYLAVYEVEAKIVGLAGLDLNEIRLMHVSPQRWRTGIGRALLNHLKAMTPASFFIEIFVYSSLAAADFYKAQGFSEKGPASFAMEGESIHTIFMTCPTRSSSYQTTLPAKK